MERIIRTKEELSEFLRMQRMLKGIRQKDFIKEINSSGNQINAVEFSKHNYNFNYVFAYSKICGFTVKIDDTEVKSVPDIMEYIEQIRKERGTKYVEITRAKINYQHYKMIVGGTKNLQIVTLLKLLQYFGGNLVVTN